MPERDELDLLIDSALHDYAEPRGGLEQRMIAQIAAHTARSSRRRWLLAAMVAPAIAALIVLGYLLPKEANPRPGETAYHAATPSVAPRVAPPIASTARKTGSLPHAGQREHAPDRVRVNNAISRPKLEVFPTPQPLTGEEQALVRLLAQTPEADRKGIIEAQRQADEPLNISAIRIPPLQVTEEIQH